MSATSVICCFFRRITTDNSPKAFIFIFLYKMGVRHRDLKVDRKQEERNHSFVMDSVLPRPHTMQVVAVGLRRMTPLWTVDEKIY